MRLTWADESDNESGFRIERSTDAKSYQHVSAVTADQTTWADPDIRSGATYHYRVQSANASGTSGWTDATSPPAARNARTAIEAETFDETGNISGAGGVQFGWGKRSIGHLDHGDWVKYGDVHFGAGLDRVTIRLAVPKETAGQHIEMWIKAPSADKGGTRIGTLKTSPTKGWQDYRAQSAPASAAGTHDLYLLFSGKPGFGVADIDRVVFEGGG
jgi:hypothetical protein